MVLSLKRQLWHIFKRFNIKSDNYLTLCLQGHNSTDMWHGVGNSRLQQTHTYSNMGGGVINLPCATDAERTTPDAIPLLLNFLV